MKRLHSLLLATLILVPMASYATVAGELRTSFEVEARILDQKITEYASAREQERRSILELQRLNSDLDFVLEDPNAAASELIGLDRDVAVARDRVISASGESAERRRAMFEQMRRLAEVIRQFERAGLDVLGGASSVGGLWQIEAEPQEVTGLMDLAQNGAEVSGTIRMSTGAELSVSGTFAAGRLELAFIELRTGQKGSVVGELDEETGEILGTWQAREMGRGRPSAGGWMARRVSPGTLVEGDR